MSGSTIGGVVGAAIGFVVSGFNPAGAMWGWQIGSLVGAIVDPDVIEGPRLQESRTQTATDGVALTYGYGTYRCAGNVTWVDEVKEHRHEDDGKGGPVQVTYTYTISYMVTVCKGPISGYKLIRRNGKIVYDARTDAELTALGYSSQEIAETRAAQAEFLQRATLYYGTNDQMPDPTMVAVLGAGNVPAYTGVAYIVMTDDETREGEYAQFEFVVANCGERHDSTPAGQLVITGGGQGLNPTPFLTATATALPTIVGIPTDTGADQGDNAVGVTPDGLWVAFGPNGILYSTSPDTEWTSAPGVYSTRGKHATYDEGNGWLLQYEDYSTVRASKVPTDAENYVFTVNGGGPTSHLKSFTSYAGGYLASRATISGGPTWMRTESLGHDWESISLPAVEDGANINIVMDALEYQGAVYICCWVKVGLLGAAGNEVRMSVDGGESFPTLLVRDTTDNSSMIPNHLCAGGGVIIAVSRNCTHVYTSADGWASPHPTGVSRPIRPTGSSWLNENNGRSVAYAAGLFFIIGTDGIVSTPDGINFSEVVPWPSSFSTPISIAGTDYSGHGTPIPDAPGYFINPSTGEITGPSGTQIDPCKPSLGEIVAAQCDKRGVDSRDVSELTDLVGGYRIAKPSSPLANIQGLQPAYFFGASEFDGKLHFPKRGRELTFALTYDDMVERDGDLIQWERVQERDLLRKVTVAYTDPATNYADTTQQAERRSATVNAEGESVMELPITGDKDWAAQVADKSIKVAWGEPDECTFHVSIAHAELVTGAEGTVPYTDGTPTVVRIERIDDEGLVRMVHARKTRPHLYESNASGAAKPLPRFPGSNVRGPTDGMLMNLPVLLDQDDRPGIHWAAAGMLSGWQGGQLQIRRAGQWTVAGTVYGSAGIGTLLDPLPAHAGDVDTANVLRVRFNEPLESVTWVNLLQERNPFAILRDDGTAEIIQAQDVTATAPNEYELTTLLRRRLATETSDHAEGARIVYLDQRVQYATLEPTDVGTTLEYRFVSVGTDPDAAPIQTLDLTTMESQREWPVADLSVEVDGDDYVLTWLRRDRLGTDVLPIRSANWAGYEVSYSWSGGSGSVVVTDETHTFTLPGASDITFSVAQLNQYTGAGPAQTVTIP